MGVHAVVIVENRKALPLARFYDLVEKDEWGRFAALRVGDHVCWEEFEWETKRYFSWRCSPRFAYLGFADENPYEGKGPDPRNDCQLTFLKAMLAVERIAGGPVYLGVDVVELRTPREASDPEVEFHLPCKLDAWLHDWREVEGMSVADPGLVF